MEEVNKNTEFNDTDKKLHISDVSDGKKSIKHIIQNNEYWFFKKTSDCENCFYNSDRIHFVRTIDKDKIIWFFGYINNFGLVESTFGTLTEERQKQLECEFQSSN